MSYPTSYSTIQPRFGWSPWRKEARSQQEEPARETVKPNAKPPEIRSEAPKPSLPQNGVWVVTERIPAKLGGLGEVAKTIPETIANLMPTKDLRIIVPYLTAHAQWDERNPDKRFEETGVSMRMNCHDGVEREFTVLQKFEPAPGQTKNGNWVYAIRNDELFRAKLTDPKTNTQKEVGLQLYTYDPKAGEYEKVMMFNRAAAKLVPLLNGENGEFRNSRLRRFGDDKSVNPDRRQIDFVIVHDWLTGPVLHELPNDVTRRKIFMLHNKYDKIQIPKVAKGIGLQTPGDLYDQEDLYSPLHLGIASADAIIGEHNFVHSLLNTPLSQGEQYTKALREKYEQQQRHLKEPDKYKPVIYDMHHGLAADFTPIGKNDPDTLQSPNPLKESRETWLQKLCQAKENELKAQGTSAADIAKALQAIRTEKQTVKPFQFEPLKSPTVENIRRFKEANKLALQRKLGLEEDKDAIIMGWAARLEPRQKGFFLVQYCMEKLLAQNEENERLQKAGKPAGRKVQFVIYGDTADSALKEWVEAKNNRYGEKGKKWLHMPNRFADHVAIKQLSAGGDFTILPSIYEPYGLTQLEAMKMCTIPIVHGVDGLRSSVTDDPSMLPKIYKADFGKGEGERVWKYPQNGFLMEPLDWKYMDYIDRRQEAESVLGLLKSVEHPEGAAARLSMGERLKNLDGRLQEAVGSRKSKLAALKRESGQTDRKEDPTQKAQTEKRMQELDKQIRDITHWKRAIEGSGKMDAEAKKALTQIFDLSQQERDINERESGKLLSAMQRALRLAEQKPDELLQIRLNGMNYVDQEHNWNGIVSRRYRPVIEDESNLPRPEIPAAKAPKSFVLPAQETWDKPETWPTLQPTDSAPKSATPASFLQELLSIPSRIWAAIANLLGWRKD